MPLWIDGVGWVPFRASKRMHRSLSACFKIVQIEKTLRNSFCKAFQPQRE